MLEWRLGHCDAARVEEAHWARSDAWVLAAIVGAAGGDGPCSLGEVVAAGDGINHAVLTGAEIEQGVRRLLGAGLISTQARRFDLTASGRALATRRRGGLVGQVDELLTALRGLAVVEETWSLEPGEIEEASRWWQRKSRRISR